MEHKSKTTSWSAVATWYDEYLETGTDSYQAKVIAPNLLRLLDLQNGERVLDLACGQGYFSRLLHTAGGEVVGVDLSEKLIALAQEKIKIKESGITYVVAPAHDTKQKKESFDAVICVLALENIKNGDETVAEVARVLKNDRAKKARALFVLLHPAFRIPQHADWGYDTKKNLQYRRVEKYLSEIKIDIEQNPHRTQKSIVTTTFHRPLQWYMKLFKKHGFAITAMEEWISHKSSQSGPKKEMEDRARKEFPLFLAVEIRKN